MTTPIEKEIIQDADAEVIVPADALAAPDEASILPDVASPAI